MLALLTMFAEWLVGEHKKPNSMWSQWVESPEDRKKDRKKNRQASSDEGDPDVCRFCGGKMLEWRDKHVSINGDYILYCGDCGRTPASEDDDSEDDE